MSGPWTFDQARQACADASRHQKAAEDALTAAAKDFAQAEEAYRLRLAEAIIEIHSEGTAWTACEDLARGRKDVAALRRERDIKEGVREAMQQACWRRTADRKDAQRFADWSQRKEVAGAYGDPT